MKRWRRLGNQQPPGGPIGDHVKSAIMNHIIRQQDRLPSTRRKFRCAHCRERFLSRALCQSHIRERHPHARLRHHNSTTTGNNNKPLYARPCMEDSEKDIVMQAFTLQETNADMNIMHKAEEEGHDRRSRHTGKHSFANSIVCLPVYQRIPEPITVSFTLTTHPCGSPRYHFIPLQFILQISIAMQCRSVT